MRRSAPARVLVLEKTMVARKVVVNTAASTGGKDSGGKKGGKPYGEKFGGKGLGKDGNGSAGFKGKGQGPADGCWTCGGARFSY